MFEIDIYVDTRGYSDIDSWIMELSAKSKTNKDSRIQLSELTRYLDLLKNHGLQLPTNYLKHLVGDIWELRPGKNRILLFYFLDEKFILLHHFRKKTQKTPKREIEKAINEMNDYLFRNGGKTNANMG